MSTSLHKLGIAVFSLTTLIAIGCAADPTGGGKAIDVVPISVNVTPIFTDPLKPLLQIETTLSDSGATDCTLLFFYDIRDEAGIDPNMHLDADDFLELDVDARQRRFSISGNKYSMFVKIKALGTMETKVNVVAMGESAKKGAYGKGTLPAAATP